MKTKLAILSFILLTAFSYANGILITDASNAECLKVLNSVVEVSVDNQVALVTSTQIFKNDFDRDKVAKYAFPLPEGASATGLEWEINGQWHTAIFKPGPQDSTLPGPGGSVHQALTNYLGKTPVYFTIDDTLKSDSTITVKITYVQLLKYEFGIVKFSYPNDLSSVQDAPLNLQRLVFNLSSQRTIDSIALISHTPVSLSNSGNSAEILFEKFENPADKNYDVEYSLSKTELGLFSMSTSFPDSLVPDSSSNGFFLFIAEPNPAETSDIIKKVFTLIIDRSGSMGGTKMLQARDAASFIVNHLNEGDKFNLIGFDDQITSFRTQHVSFNEDNKLAALQFISALDARGLTNISGAFETAINQFEDVNDSTANIIIFLTDGQATVGLINTEEILNHVRGLVNQKDSSLTIFNFGIGADVNRQLLTLLASENSGIADFLNNNEVESAVTSFYLKIQNPVLLNTQMTFNPFTVVDTYPSPLPNLYKGQQLLVAGRYQEAAPVTVTLSGQAFGQPVQYSYQLSLSDSGETKYMFLSKIWAKLKIENLLVQYYSLPVLSEEATVIKNEIVDLSIKFGVLSPFTNLSGNPGGTGVEQIDGKNNPTSVKDFELVGNYPNPFNPGTTIVFRANKNVYAQGTIRIYNIVGELVREISVFVNGEGRYEIYWDGNDQSGNVLPSGSYIYVISVENFVTAGKMNLIK